MRDKADAPVRDLESSAVSQLTPTSLEHRYARVLAETPEAVMVCVGGRVRYANAAARDLLGVATDADIIDRPLFRFLSGEAFPADGVLAAPRKEFVATTSRRARVPVEVTTVALPWLGPAAQMLVLHDISRRKLGEETLRLQALAFENLYDAVVISDIEGRIVDWNPAAERIYGYSRGEVIGQTAALWDPRVNDAPVSDAILNALRHQGRWSGEITYRRKDGSRGVTETIVVPIVDGEGRHLGHVGVNHDVTERARSREALEHSLSVLRATLESTADGILVVDHAGDVVTHNRKLLRMWGLTPDDLARGGAHLVQQVIVAQLRDAERFATLAREAQADPESDTFEVFKCNDGRVVECYSQPHWMNGVSAGRVWSFRDVTEREKAQERLRESEEQLRQSQKLEAIGLLAGGVAHDFSNLLTVVRAYTDGLRQLLAPDHAGRREVEEIRRALDQASGLTRQLLTFGRKQVVQLRALDLNEIVADMRDMLQRVIGEDINLRTELADDLGFVTADEGQMQQVLLNLAVNARDAMPDGGSLSIRTWRILPDAEYARRHMGVDVPLREYAVMSIADTGTGMEEALKSRVFEPFFTTKEPGRGTGLGLSTVYGIVKQCGGFIWLDSQLNVGTTFHIYIPVSTAVAPTDTTPVEVAAPGAATILVIEDDDDLRGVVVYALQRRGHRVFEARDGIAATEVAAKIPHLDLIVSDVVLPRLGGVDAVERIRRILHRDALVVFISGYVPNSATAERLSRMQTAIVEKPFSMDELVAVVQRALVTR